MMFSVVIPVYNVESTLERCVASVLAQNVSMEVVLVDDGSTDSSPELCRRLAAADKRVRLIQKANGGLSSARNAGIEAASGDYITFVDSDDSLLPGTYAEVSAAMAAIGWPDMTEYGMRLFVGAPWERTLSFGSELYRDPLEYWFRSRAWAHCYACNKLFRRSLFANVRFPEGRWFEDSWTLPQLLRQCRSVATVPTVGYVYTYNATGITSTADARRYSDLLQAEVATLQALPDSVKGKYSPEMALYYEQMLNDQLTAYELGATSLLLPLLPYRKTVKQKLLHIIGLKRLCKLNKLIHRLRPPRH